MEKWSFWSQERARAEPRDIQGSREKVGANWGCHQEALCKRTTGFGEKAFEVAVHPGARNHHRHGALRYVRRKIEYYFLAAHAFTCGLRTRSDQDSEARPHSLQTVREEAPLQDISAPSRNLGILPYINREVKGRRFMLFAEGAVYVRASEAALQISVRSHCLHSGSRK